MTSAVPSSYAAAVEPTAEIPSQPFPQGSKDLICPYLAHGECPYDNDCEYLHGDICDLCGQAVLHPDDNQQREEHQKVLVKFLGFSCKNFKLHVHDFL